MSQSAQTAAKPSKPKCPTILSGFIFIIFKMALMSLVALLVLAIWFFGEAFFVDQNTAIRHAQSIVMANARFIEQSPLPGSSSFSHWLFYFHEHLTQFINSCAYFDNKLIQTIVSLLTMITEIILSRIFVFLLALPLFFIILFIFFIDGLVKRDIRKFKGARESTFMFHRGKYLMRFCFFIVFLIYLAMPVFIMPSLFLLIQSILLGIVVSVSATYFKKYV